MRGHISCLLSPPSPETRLAAIGSLPIAAYIRPPNVALLLFQRTLRRRAGAEADAGLFRAPEWMARRSPFEGDMIDPSFGTRKRGEHLNAPREMPILGCTLTAQLGACSSDRGAIGGEPGGFVERQRLGVVCVGRARSRAVSRRVQPHVDHYLRLEGDLRHGFRQNKPDATLRHAGGNSYRGSVGRRKPPAPARALSLRSSDRTDRRSINRASDCVTRGR